MFYIYTVASDQEKLRPLLETASLHGTPIQNFEIQHWTGYIDKILAMKTVVDGLQEDDIVCFIDAYDVLVMANYQEILQKFLKSGYEILMSTELNCYPMENQSKYDYVEYCLFEKEHEKGIWGTSESKMPKTNYKYMNSGGMIGYGKAMKTMFQWKSEEEMRQIIELGGDQNYFTQYFLERYDKANIGLDYNQEIFQSLYKVDFKDFCFFHGRLYNHCLRTYPCFVHFNGFRDYGGVLTKNGIRRDAMQVFVECMKESIDKGNVGMEWKLPEFWYGGKLVGTINQIK
jgi:hypothetical protein